MTLANGRAGLATPVAKLKVIGVGGAGTNAVNRMVEAQVGGVDFIAMNTDRLALAASLATTKMQLGENLTKGLGAGGNPDVGRQAAEESKTEIKRSIEGSDMVFITAGMGGGTGTGAAPIVAEVARELGVLTVAVVTRPFEFEGAQRRRLADEGIEALRAKVDTVITVPNDRLLAHENKRLTLSDAFRMADDVLRQGVQGISDIVTIRGDVNVDFADVRATIYQAGTALMGIGEAEGEDRAVQAAQMAISSPLLETSIDGAMRVLINVTSGEDLTLMETAEATQLIKGLCDQQDANIYFGWVVDPAMGGKVRVTVLATGFAGRGAVRQPLTPAQQSAAPPPTARSLETPSIQRLGVPEPAPQPAMPAPAPVAPAPAPVAQAPVAPAPAPVPTAPAPAPAPVRAAPVPEPDDEDLEIPPWLRPH